jgi:hypothetical protein
MVIQECVCARSVMLECRNIHSLLEKRPVFHLTSMCQRHALEKLPDFSERVIALWSASQLTGARFPCSCRGNS